MMSEHVVSRNHRASAGCEAQRSLPLAAIACVILAAGWSRASLASDELAVHTVHHAAELQDALSRCDAGAEILLLPGEYSADIVTANIHGTESRPVRLRGALTADPPVLRGRRHSLRLSSVSHLILENLVIETGQDSALLIDSGNGNSPPCHHITLRSLTIRGREPSRSTVGVRMMTVDEVEIADCRFEGWGPNGCGLNLVGCERGTIRGCRFDGRGIGLRGLQIQGGSRSIAIEDCDFLQIGERPLQIGGATDAASFRASALGFEAQNVSVRGNRFCGGECGVAFVNADGTLVEENVFYRQRKNVIRILQENVSPGFLPCRNGMLRQNIIVWRHGDLLTVAGIGPQTQPATFEFHHNYWHCEDRPHQSVLPGFPAPETGGVHGQDPRLFAPADCDLRPLRSLASMDRAAESLPAWFLWVPVVGRAVVWLLVVVTLAFGLYVGLRSAFARSADSHETPAFVQYTYAGLFVLGSLLFIYGSLLPFEYRPTDLQSAWNTFQNIPYLDLGVYHLADWMANLLIMVPIAYFGTATATVHRPHWAVSICLAAVVFVGCAMLSISVEFAQIWFPRRTVSQNDILAELIGAAAGCVGGLLTTGSLTLWMVSICQSVNARQVMNTALQLYCVGYLIYAVMPLDVTFDLDSLALKLELRRIGLIGESLRSPSLAGLLEDAGRVLMAVPLGLYVGSRGSVSTGSAVISCAGIGLLIEFAQVFVFSRFASLTDAAFTTAGMAVGAIAARRTKGDCDAWWTEAAAAHRRPVVTVAVLVYALGLLAFMAPPWKFDLGQAVGERLQSFRALPFAALYWGSEFHALTVSAAATAMFVPLGLALADFCVSSPRAGLRRPLMLSFVGLAVFAALLEILQAWIPGTTVDSTVSLSYLAGALLGSTLRLMLYYVSTPADSTAEACVAPRRFWIPECAIVAGGTVWLSAAVIPELWAVPAAASRTVTRGNSATSETAPLVRGSSPPAVNVAGAELHLDRVALPSVPEARAIWGSTGRDAAGGIWFGLSLSQTESASARLLRLDSSFRRAHEVGSVLPQLNRDGLHVPKLSQSKIHTRIVQGADGWLYFASMDEAGEAEDGTRLPIWGSHLWRLRPEHPQFEHLAAMPEGLIALAAGGRWIYALGLFDHIVYQFDTASQSVNHTRVGSVGGHISRNLLADERGHVYVPRLTYSGPPDGIPHGQPTGDTPGVTVTLVELDASLQLCQEMPLEEYFFGDRWTCHGITGVEKLKNGSLLFISSGGYLYRIDFGPGAMSNRLTPLGWMHPDGASYTASLFCMDGERQVVAVSKRSDGYTWTLFDLQTRKAIAHPLRLPSGVSPQALLYGSMTRDNAGAIYLGGTEGNRPLLLRGTFRTDDER